MKKLIAFAIVMDCLISCQKSSNEPQVVPPQSLKIKMENGHLAFKSAEVYNNLLTTEKPENLIKTIKGSETFLSMADQYKKQKQMTGRVMNNCDVPDSLIEDNQTFFSILDKDGVVQIDTTLYRYDYCRDRVWVISAANAANSSFNADFMNGVERTNVVGYFPSYVDAIEAVAAGYTTMPDEATVQGNEIFERPASLFGPENLENFWIGNNPKDEKERNLFDGKLSYDKFAIYFHLYGKEKYQTPCVFNWCTSLGGPRDWNVAFQYTYRRKGNSYDNSGTGTLDAPLSGENKVDKTVYEGNRGLKNGKVVWDVNHVYAKWVFIERFGGFGWIPVVSYSLSAFGYVNNWPYVGIPPIPMHYRLQF